MISFHILIADLMHPSICTLLKEAGYTFDYLPEITRTEIIRQIHQYEGLIVRSKTTVDEELLQNAVKLKMIGRAGSGMDMLDMKAIQKRNITVLNAPEGNRDTVAEHIIGMLLTLFHKIAQSHEEVSRLIWSREKNRGMELQGKTFAIIGYGNVGQSLAKKLRGFDCKVIAYDKHKSGFSDEMAKEVMMEDIFKQADIVSINVPLTIETSKLVNEAYLDRFEKNIFLINTARGEIVSLDALRKALQKGKVLGACLDVLENEKPDTFTEQQKAIVEELIQSKKVIFTPHVAGWSFESYERINQVLVEKMKLVFKV